MACRMVCWHAGEPQTTQRTRQEAAIWNGHEGVRTLILLVGGLYQTTPLLHVYIVTDTNIVSDLEAKIIWFQLTAGLVFGLFMPVQTLVTLAMPTSWTESRPVRLQPAL